MTRHWSMLTVLGLSIALGATVAPASASDVSSNARVQLAESQDGAGKHKGKKADKEKADHVQSSERSNKGGETRGKDRAGEVQALQDSGRGAQHRSQKPR